MKEQVTIEVELAYIECCNCGVVFGMPQSLKQQLLDTKNSFWCPNGHRQSYTGEAQREKAERLGRELKEVRRWQEYWEGAYSEEAQEHKATRNSLRATKAAKTKLKNRIKNGVCPCCKRHFTNLQRHIKTKHPDFTIEDPKENESQK